MTPILSLAIATDRKVRRVGQGGQQIKNPGRIGLVHLGRKFPFETLPSGLVFRV